MGWDVLLHPLCSMEGSLIGIRHDMLGVERGGWTLLRIVEEDYVCKVDFVRGADTAHFDTVC